MERTTIDLWVGIFVALGVAALLLRDAVHQACKTLSGADRSHLRHGAWRSAQAHGLAHTDTLQEPARARVAVDQPLLGRRRELRLSEHARLAHRAVRPLPQHEAPESLRHR